MSTATIRKVESSSNQPLRKSAGKHSGIEPIARPPAKFGVQSESSSAHRPDAVAAADNQNGERLLNARKVAAQLGVSERFVRDHTTRRSPKIRAIKMGMLIRYRQADVDAFMEELGTLPPSSRSRSSV